MKPERYQRICEVFVAARSKSHVERASYLEATCGDDTRLREEVESLLANDDAATNFLDNPVLGDDFLIQAPPPRATAASEVGIQPASPPPTIRHGSNRRTLWIAALCIAFAGMAMLSVRQASQSSDERDEARRAATLVEQERTAALQKTATIAIDAADVAIKANDVAAALRYLDAVPNSLRDATWQALLRRTDESIIALDEHDGAVLSLAFSPDGHTLASAATDGTLRLWDAESHRLQKTILMPAIAFTSIAFAPAGTVLVAGTLGGDLTVWDTERGEPLATWRAHESKITCIAVSPDGMTLASAGEDATVRLWDAAANDETNQIEHPAAATSVAFDATGKRLATGCTDGIARLWRLDGNQATEILQLHAEYCESRAPHWPVVGFSPDGKTLAVGCVEGLVTLWNLDKGDQRLTLTGHCGGIQCVSFSPDGSRLVTGSSDTTLRLWNTSSGALLSTLRGHTGSVTSVTLGPRGDLLATSSLDTTIRLWNPESRSDQMETRQ